VLIKQGALTENAADEIFARVDKATGGLQSCGYPTARAKEQIGWDLAYGEPPLPTPDQHAAQDQCRLNGVMPMAENGLDAVLAEDALSPEEEKYFRSGGDASGLPPDDAARSSEPTSTMSAAPATTSSGSRQTPRSTRTWTGRPTSCDAHSPRRGLIRDREERHKEITQG
jgi:hypothetical protein